MIDFFRRDKNWWLLAAFAVLLLGAVLTRVGITREITLIVNGETRQVRTAALTVAGVLRSGEVSLQKEDLVVPERGTFFWDADVIQVQQAQTIMILTPEGEQRMVTPERVPSNLMGMMGIDLFPEDRLRINGQEIDPQAPLEFSGEVVLQYDPARTLRLEIDGIESVHHTQAVTLGAALEAEGIHLASQDWVSQPLSTPINDELAVSIRRALPVTINIAGATVTGWSASTTVGEALQDIGVSLQNLDYSLPSEDALLPESREIEVVRVREDVMIMTDEVAYENEYLEDPGTLLDQVSVIEPGQVGIYATRERVRFEDGNEVDRMDQETWQASEARDGVLGYGTRAEIRTAVVDGQTIEYWRKISVYATSYKPCDNQGVCHDGTATGIPLQKGVVAVRPHWISVPNGYGMWLQPVYVPGYGHAVIGDTGGGIPGTPWIDLAYRDENYVSWHQWTTLYFLPPIPNWYPAIIVP